MRQTTLGRCTKRRGPGRWQPGFLLLILTSHVSSLGIFSPSGKVVGRLEQGWKRVVHEHFCVCFTMFLSSLPSSCPCPFKFLFPHSSSNLEQDLNIGKAHLTICVVQILLGNGRDGGTRSVFCMAPASDQKWHNQFCDISIISYGLPTPTPSVSIYSSLYCCLSCIEKYSSVPMSLYKGRK